MPESSEGATITEIVEALDWQAHTVRGAISGALKKKLGLDVGFQEVEGRARAYWIEASSSLEHLCRREWFRMRSLRRML